MDYIRCQVVYPFALRIVRLLRACVPCFRIRYPARMSGSIFAPNFEKILCNQYFGIFNSPESRRKPGGPGAARLYRDYQRRLMNQGRVTAKTPRPKQPGEARESRESGCWKLTRAALAPFALQCICLLV